MKRRSDIDWLRAGAMLAIFFFHGARFFDAWDWHLKNAVRPAAFSIFTGFLSQWLMPLFFLLSGFGSWYALESRSPGGYLRDRVKRLLVPYYLLGLFILIPPQYYWEQVTHGIFSGSFLEFLPRCFHYAREPQFLGIYLGPHPLYFLTYWAGHLWFLHYLFLISLVGLPVMIWLKTPAGRSLMAKTAALCSRKAGIFLLAIPLAAIQMAFRAKFPDYLSWADFFTWLCFFLIGYVFAGDERFNRGIERSGWRGLALGGVATCLLVFLVFGKIFVPGKTQFGLGFLGFQALLSLNAWAWIVFFLFAGLKWLSFRNAVLSYCREAVLPFYILHQTVILAVGSWVIHWDLGPAVKYLVICPVSFLLIMAVYEGAVKRTAPLRFLFGLKPGKTLAPENLKCGK